MPQFNWNNTPDNDYLVPAGTYLCEIDDVEIKHSQNGNEWWNIKLKIIEGDHEGRSFFDKYFFTPKSLPRLKFICSRLGLNTEGEVDFQPPLILGKRALITTIVEEYQANDGTMKKKNTVPFDGYAFAKEKLANAPKPMEDDLPF